MDAPYIDIPRGRDNDESAQKWTQNYWHLGNVKPKLVIAYTSNHGIDSDKMVSLNVLHFKFYALSRDIMGIEMFTKSRLSIHFKNISFKRRHFWKKILKPYIKISKQNYLFNFTLKSRNLKGRYTYIYNI